MSFSEECKIEFWEEEPPKKPCCRRALATGLLFCAETPGGAFSLTLPGSLGERVADFLEKQLRTQVERVSFRRTGRDYCTLTLVSGGVRAQLQRADMSDLPLPKLLNFDCDACLRYFLRGVLIAAGSITDPVKTHHMEISCHDATTAHRLSSLWAEIGDEPKLIRRRGGVNLYYKNSVAMEDIFSYLHARRTLFALINSKIERDIRNNENRATNCVAQNIQKAVRAAGEHMAAIEALRESGAWDKLPLNLRETAELREANPDATLAELAHMHNPPITKSGLNHRLQKLTELARETAVEK